MEKKIVCAGIIAQNTSSLKSTYISDILENLDFSKSFSQLSEVYTECKKKIAKVKNPLIKAEFEKLAEIGAEADGHKITLNDLCFYFYPNDTPIPNVYDCFRGLKLLLCIWYPFWKMNNEEWVFNSDTKKRLFSAISKIVDDEEYKSLRVDIRNAEVPGKLYTKPPTWIEFKMRLLYYFSHSTYNENLVEFDNKTISECLLNTGFQNSFDEILTTFENVFKQYKNNVKNEKEIAIKYDNIKKIIENWKCLCMILNIKEKESVTYTELLKKIENKELKKNLLISEDKKKHDPYSSDLPIKNQFEILYDIFNNNFVILFEKFYENLQNKKTELLDEKYKLVSNAKKVLKHFYEQTKNITKRYFNVENDQDLDFNNLKTKLNNLKHKFETPLLSCHFSEKNKISKITSSLINSLKKHSNELINKGIFKEKNEKLLENDVDYFSVLENKNEDKKSDLIGSDDVLDIIDGKEKIPEDYLKLCNNFKDDPEYNKRTKKEKEDKEKRKKEKEKKKKEEEKRKKKEEKEKENLTKRGWHKAKGWFGGIFKTTKKK